MKGPSPLKGFVFALSWRIFCNSDGRVRQTDRQTRSVASKRLPATAAREQGGIVIIINIIGGGGGSGAGVGRPTDRPPW